MTTPLRLHSHDLSGHSHRVELFLSLLGLPHEKIHVDLMQGAQKKPEFLALNPRGQVPVLEDGDVVLADSNAILVYLALRYDREGTWYPQGAVTVARIQRWFSIAAGELVSGPGNARLVKLLGAKFDLEQAHRGAALLYGLMEKALEASRFLVSDSPTLADIALYSYTAVADEGDVSLEPYPAVRAWLGRLEALPRFLPMRRVRSLA